MEPFDYHRPRKIEDAFELLSTGEARLLAGGTDLIPQLREGRRAASRIVDVKHVAELAGISETSDGGVAIGAAVPATKVAQNTRVATDYPAIAASAKLIGSWQVQNRASLGGNICNAAPSADAVPPLLCLGAQAQIAGPAGQRSLPLDQLFVGPGKTVLGKGELLMAIHLPAIRKRSAAHYIRLTPRREMDIAIVGAAAWIVLDEAGSVSDARIALASVGPTPILASTAARGLIGGKPSRELFEKAGQLAQGDAKPISDTRASADYRSELVQVLTRRALSHCAAALGAEV